MAEYFFPKGTLPKRPLKDATRIVVGEDPLPYVEPPTPPPTEAMTRKHERGDKMRLKARYAREVFQALRFDPAEVMAEIVKTGKVFFRNPDGSLSGGSMDVPVEEWGKFAREAMRYCYPSLSAIQVTGKNEGPIQLVTADLNKMLENPESIEMAMKLALQIDQNRPPEEDETIDMEPGDGE